MAAQTSEIEIYETGHIKPKLSVWLDNIEGKLGESTRALSAKPAKQVGPLKVYSLRHLTLSINV